MLGRWRTLLNVEPFLDELAENAGMVSLIQRLFVLLLAGLSLSAMLNGLAAQNPLRAILLHLCAIGILGMLWALLRRGYVRTTTWLFLVAFWVMVTLTNFALGGANSPAISAYHALILLAGILIGLRAALLIAAASILTITGLGAASVYGLIPSPLSPAQIVSRSAVSIAITVLLTMGLVVLMRIVQGSIVKIRANRDELADALARLGQTSVSRDFVDNILRSMSNLLIVLEHDNTIRMVNKATVSALGYSEAELIGQRFEVLQELGDRRSQTELLQTFDETTHEREDVFVTKGGQRLHVSFNYAPLRNSEGMVTGMVCLGQDITLRKQAEIERERGDRRYRALFEQSYDGIVLMSTDGKPLDFNARAGELLGYTREELSGLNYRDIFLPQATSERGDATLLQVRLISAPTTTERLLRRKDGSEFTAEVRLQTVREADHTPIYIQCYFRDITERIRNDQKMHFHDKLLQTVADAVIAIDRDERIISWNRAAAALYGYEEGEVLGRAIREVIPTQFQSGVEAFIKEKYLIRGVWLNEMTQFNRQGQPLNISSAVSVLLDANEVMFGIVMVNRDITRSKQAEMEIARMHEVTEQQRNQLQEMYEQVSNLEKYQGLMMRLARHDVRSALGNIEMYLKALDLPSNRAFMDKHGDNLAKIFENLPRAKNLLEELLTVEPMETQALDLSELARRAVNQQRTESARKSQTLLTEISREPIWVFGNPIQLFRALFNLVENAVKYTPEGRQIEVRLHQGAGEALFEVEDRGRGIPDDQQAALFTPNYRVKSAENEDIPGTGMGLYLVQTIIARHGGRIIFRSRVGKGSVFGFALPLHNADQGPVSQSAG